MLPLHCHVLPLPCAPRVALRIPTPPAIAFVRLESPSSPPRRLPTPMMSPEAASWTAMPPAVALCARRLPPGPPRRLLQSCAPRVGLRTSTLPAIAYTVPRVCLRTSTLPAIAYTVPRVGLRTSTLPAIAYSEPGGCLHTSTLPAIAYSEPGGCLQDRHAAPSASPAVDNDAGHERPEGIGCPATPLPRSSPCCPAEATTPATTATLPPQPVSALQRAPPQPATHHPRDLGRADLRRLTAATGLPTHSTTRTLPAAAHQAAQPTYPFSRYAAEGPHAVRSAASTIPSPRQIPGSPPPSLTAYMRATPARQPSQTATHTSQLSISASAPCSARRRRHWLPPGADIPFPSLRQLTAPLRLPHEVWGSTQLRAHVRGK
ncbi:hypothetical protein Agub_g4166 [Astrephomene gubernaculifera]|uniref:Uncharacterized protein n=1 Tax=Astrephomene gubernaculifera TaxID=47775 RepID=A0AAD3HJ10_9CHLO|nr:hypothetical protein Agub_g4166 [Astrephomene gubernaculifera]